MQLVAWNNAGTFTCISTSPLGLLIVLNAKASGMRCTAVGSVAEIWKMVVDALSSLKKKKSLKGLKELKAFLNVPGHPV